MKIQNLSIIFLVIVIPLVMILSYYLNLQRDTLELQAIYDTKLSEATKEGIKAFEVNTVDWASKKQNDRSNTMAMINAFMTSLSNNLNISGTAKELMENYIPAIAVTMYDGYYIYAPTYTPITKENTDGVQLFYNETTSLATTNSENGKVLYEAEDGKGTTYTYKYQTDPDTTITEYLTNLTTDIADAKMDYLHTLNSKIAYSSRYIKGTLSVIVNYTLDNRIYIYGVQGTDNIDKDGYLVYFDTDTVLPRININPAVPQDKLKESDIEIKESVANTVYSKKNGATTNKTEIQTETLTEQILYKDGISTTPKLGTFKYLYDITSQKLYYDEDETEDNFFILKSDGTREFLQNSVDIYPGSKNSEQCRYKSVSVLVGDGDTTEYKKIYQVLNGRDRGKWYMDLKEDSEEAKNSGSIEVDTEITGINLAKLGLLDTGNFAAIYKDYSAINYYVESYAFTNWVKQNLGGQVENRRIVYNEEEEKYENESIILNGLFDISQINDPENVQSQIVQHKREVMIDNINMNLNLSISNYNRNGRYDFRLPVLSYSDWEQVFSNISLITFFQGVPIGLKYYNNYAIATSTTNREYVDPYEIYFSGNDPNYHRVYCEKCKNEIYTGYRSVEYSMREYTNDTETIYYYQHDNATPSDKNSETACYYCVVNKENYNAITDGMPEAAERTYKQAKVYNEALARERYYQYEKLTGKLGINITYHYNTEGWEDIISQTGLPDPQEAEIGVQVTISTQKPEITSSDQFTKYVFVGWSEDPNSTEIDYMPGETIITGDEDINLYAIWRISLSNLEWQRDYTFLNEADAFKNGQFNNTSYGSVTDGSISYIYIDEMPDGNGSRIQMVGNENKLGKGAAWATFTSAFLNIAEFSFDYYLDAGHSFNAGGFMFNISETNPGDPKNGTLEGYMLSINFNFEMLSAAGGNTGAIFKFRYEKGKNEQHFEELIPIQTFDIGKYDSGRGSSGNGNVVIQVAENGYILKGNELTADLFIPVDSSEMNPNSFGFFSDHFGREHGHTCTNIGYFRLENVQVIAVRDK